MSVIDNHLAPAPSPLEEVCFLIAEQAAGFRSERETCETHLAEHRAQVALWSARRDAAEASEKALEASVGRMKAESAAGGASG